MHAVVCHGIRPLLGLHHRHDSVHVWNIHGQPDPVRSFRVDERTNVRHTKGPEDFLAFWRREPMPNIVDIVIGQYVRHLSSRLRAIAKPVALPAACRT
jgi:hypothetical protein